MIDDLKALAQLLVELPHIALWAILAFMFYKLSVIASLYGVIRYIVGRVCTTYEMSKCSMDSESLAAASPVLAMRLISVLKNFYNQRLYSNDIDDIERALMYYKKYKFKVDRELAADEDKAK